MTVTVPEIRQIDPADEAALRDWYAAMREGALAGRPAPLVDAFEEILAQLREADDEYDKRAYAAVDNGGVVGTLWMSLPLHGNVHTASLDINVRPGLRGRGHGSALLAHAYAVAARNGRRTVSAEVGVAPGAPHETSPGARFALRNGFTSALCEKHSVLDLPPSPDALAAIGAGGILAAAGLTTVSWVGRCPDEHVDAYARMRGIMETDVPWGDLDQSPTPWPPERVRAGERREEARGMTLITTAALTSDGAPAGYTQLEVPAHVPGVAYQNDTLVLAEHRGRRLSAALKVRNLELLDRAATGRSRVHTWNAEVNGPMLAVNTALGFRTVEMSHEFQRIGLPAAAAGA
ncbi:GNAT family N-acetyltransferase [Nocardiopsis mangrovi]|uniref:GNAT family N-acetyltransferase n=1 Tax=Nocardiopsis mangrovi TaxID=1179818 RepID=A0ABV9DRB0_9ACTN